MKDYFTRDEYKYLYELLVRAEEVAASEGVLAGPKTMGVKDKLEKILEEETND